MIFQQMYKNAKLIYGDLFTRTERESERERERERERENQTN